MTPASFFAAYGPSVAAFAVFGLLHSVAAREPFKEWLGRLTAPFFVEHFWRITYCALSFWALYYGIGSLHWERNIENDVWLLAYPAWLWQGVTLAHLGSVALVYIAFLQSDYLEFLGFTQAWRGMRALAGRPAAKLELFGTDRLVVSGVYRWVRHPMLTGGLAFLLTSGPSLNNLVYTAMYVTYMVIGAYYEERRMIRLFGDDYIAYKRRVGAFFPRLRRGVR